MYLNLSRAYNAGAQFRINGNARAISAILCNKYMLSSRFEALLATWSRVASSRILQTALSAPKSREFHERLGSRQDKNA